MPTIKDKVEAKWTSITQPPPHNEVVLVRTTEPQNTKRQFAVLAFYWGGKWRDINGACLSTKWPNISLVWTDIPALDALVREEE